MANSGVIAPLAGIAVVACALLGQSVGLADGGVQVNGQGPVAGSRPGLPSPGQQLAAHPVELTDVAPPEAAQEGAQGGWRLDRAAQSAGRPPGAQHIGVVNTVAPSQRRRHQRHHLVARVRPPRGIAQVEALPDEFGQAEVPRQGGRKEQPGIGHQAAVVEGDLDPVGVVAWQHLLGAPFPGSVFATKPLSQKHRSTFLPLQDANPTPSFGGFGLRGAQDAVVWNGPVRSAMASGSFRITSSKAPSFQMRPFQMRVTVSSARPRAFGTRPLSASSRSTSETIRQPETSVPLGGTPTMRRISIVTWIWRLRRRVANMTGRWEGARFLAGRPRPPPAPCLHLRSWRGMA